MSELESFAESAPEADLLARTAGLLVQSVDHETNPKFANSQFLGLMKQLRDRKAIVEGNDIVAASPEGQMRQTHTISADLKGKGKAVPFSLTATHDPGVSQSHIPSSVLRPSKQTTPIESEDANDALLSPRQRRLYRLLEGASCPCIPSSYLIPGLATVAS